MLVASHEPRAIQQTTRGPTRATSGEPKSARCPKLDGRPNCSGPLRFRQPFPRDLLGSTLLRPKRKAPRGWLNRAGLNGCLSRLAGKIRPPLKRRIGAETVVPDCPGLQQWILVTRFAAVIDLGGRRLGAVCEIYQWVRESSPPSVVRGLSVLSRSEPQGFARQYYEKLTFLICYKHRE